MALWVAAWALSNHAQKNAQKNAAKAEAAKAEEGEGGVAVTTEPKKKEPEGIRERAKSNADVSWIAVVCSIICVCTLPALLCGIPAAILATMAHIKAEAGEEEKAESLNKVASTLLGVTLMAIIILFIFFGVFILPWLVPVIIFAS